MLWDKSVKCCYLLGGLVLNFLDIRIHIEVEGVKEALEKKNSKMRLFSSMDSWMSIIYFYGLNKGFSSKFWEGNLKKVRRQWPKGCNCNIKIKTTVQINWHIIFVILSLSYISNLYKAQCMFVHFFWCGQIINNLNR